MIEFAMEEEERTVKEVLDRFQLCYDPKRNEIVEQYTFSTRKQQTPRLNY